MNRLNAVTSLACRIFLAGIWLWAGYYKVWNPQDFAQAVAVYDIVPLWAVNFCSVIIAWLEVIIGLLLLAGWWIKPAAMWSTALFGLYTALMVRAGITGAEHSCGCFHKQEIPVGYMHALLNFALLLVALWVFQHPSSWLLWKKTESQHSNIKT